MEGFNQCGDANENELFRCRKNESEHNRKGVQFSCFL